LKERRKGEGEKKRKKKKKKEKKRKKREEVRWSITIIRNRIIENNGHTSPFWVICNCRAQNG
jgi:hypothetical protein